MVNTQNIWLGLSSDESQGQIDLFRANNLLATDKIQNIKLIPYGNAFNKGIEVAIADVNYKHLQDNSINKSDDVTDIITVQQNLNNPLSDKFTIKVFDGKTLIEKQPLTTTFNSDQKDLLIAEITPFQNIAALPTQIASVASGDINQDGFADIVVGLGGNGAGISPIIEIYSGKDYRLLSRINPFHHEQDFQGKINLAVGDINGDNYGDIIVGQGNGGRGLVEVYSGQLINTKGTLDGNDTAHQTTLLTQEFQPYGAEYTEEIDVTSGYILQRPDEPNGFPVQTNYANLTTIAIGSVIDAREQIQVFTFKGGSQTEDNPQENDDNKYDEFYLDASLTPDDDIEEISGSFADLSGLASGEPVLFARNENGEYEIVHLGDENEPEFTVITQASATLASLLTKNNNDVFGIQGNGKVNLKVTLLGRNSNLVNEFGLFFVDDSNGTINGIAPGAAGYTQAALARSKTIFSAIANIPNGFKIDNITRLLELQAGNQLRFLLVKNSTIDAVQAGITSTTEVLFAESSSQITQLNNGEFSLAWKDASGNNVNDFQALSVKIQLSSDPLPLGTSLQGNPQAEVIDLRNVTQEVTADFIVNREAAYDNFVGFYQVTDENGGLDINGDGNVDLRPGDSGYVQAAVRGRVAGIDLTVNNQGTASYSGIFKPGSLFAPFIIVQGRPEAILDNNSNNDPAVYFPFLGANSDKVDHIRLLGNNIFGFEDLPSGGDRDFNDVIVQVNLNVRAIS